MDKIIKMALMAASAIHTALKKHSLTATRKTLGKICTAKDHCDTLVALEQKLQLAGARNWHTAFKRLVSRAHQILYTS